MNLNKHVIALALASALGACSDSSNTTIPPDELPPVVTETTVNGKAIKGVLTNAVVKVYKFDVDGTPIPLSDTELKDANISTDGDGIYTFTVLDYDGPIKIELSPSKDPEKPTTMSCDAPAGCGDDIKFGEPIDLTALDPNFKLDAISIVDSSSNGEVKVNVSALTHLAAQLIEASDTINAESVTENSAKIASTFGIAGDITLLEPTVTDNASAVAAEDNAEELRYGLINAGIMAALFSGETDGTDVLSSKLAAVAADLVANDGALLVTQDDDDGFELALAEVLEGAGEAAQLAAELITADGTLTSEISLVTLTTQLVNEQAYQEANVGDDGLAIVVVDVVTEGDAVAKAKAMVEDVRLFTHLFDETSTEGAGIKTQGDEYVALLDNAGIMMQTERDNFALLAQISTALADLSLQYDAGTLSPEAAALGVPIASYLTTTAGAVGTITFDERTATDGILFKVEAVSGTEKATLNASAEFSDDKKSITLTIDGLLESAGAKFTLNEGSFAKVNLDTAASRDALENDTYEGEIISGELELSLSLAQKEVGLVTNPITFEGMVKTKLLMVGERTLDEQRSWDDKNNQDIISYGRPELETLALPEMLTLSGAFNSLEGDSISATLTVNIDNLDGYQAPKFKYIGKEVPGVFAVNVSADKHTIVVSPSDIATNPYTLTRTFTPGDGEWTNTSSNIPAVPETHPWGESFIETEMIRTLGDVVTYSISGLIEKTDSFWAWSTKFTPVDTNADGTDDSVEVAVIGHWQKGYEYDTAALLDADGQLLQADGTARNFDDAWVIGTFNSIDDFVEFSGESWVMPYNLDMINNAADLYAQKIDNDWGGEISTQTSLGKVSVFFNEEELMALKDGSVTSLDGYITQALIKDVLTVEVSADANTVTATIEDAYTATYTFTGEVGSNFNSDEEKIDEDGTSTESIWSKVTDIGLDVPQVIVSRMAQGPWGKVNSQLKLMPMDYQVDGEVGFGEADIIIAYYLGGFNTVHGFNDDGNLVDADGNVVGFDENSWVVTEFTSYNDFDWTAESWATVNWNPLPFNPLTVSSAIDVYQGFINNGANHYAAKPYYWDGIGQVETDFDKDTLDSLSAGTTMFDGYNIEADSNDLLEDEDIFLNINAALTLEAILGDYQVKLQLSGNRTALEDGAFDLSMSYRLPGADTQRSFTAHYNTEVEGRLTANNADGVVLVLNEPDEDDTSTTQVIGRILVGPTAIEAAIIEDRDGAIFIVYADIDNDGVQEEESL
ncbi:hypothetical protein CXF85_13105 [Colwellia sp. 75C3]|uniref:hypothetical protein n=1 Tax=Colwellia sp. 75C3 TaxID=888425 RepID=UPI000C34AF5B|nr:hypothetical protein [Colwellia sp. 75C3]PKG82422.1 hypothetical protein CXF85_13105 [Colwellia sp. 75C3]